MQWIKSLIIFLLAAIVLACGQNGPAVSISNQWVRATSPGQEVGAAYMTLQSAQDATLVKVESAAAGSVEIHSMTMDDGVMKMRMMDTLLLAAGKPVELAPGGFHLMLFDLKAPLVAGKKLEFILHLKDAAGRAFTQTVTAPIQAGAD